jgi:hypothetical protein
MISLFLNVLLLFLEYMISPLSHFQSIKKVSPIITSPHPQIAQISQNGSLTKVVTLVTVQDLKIHEISRSLKMAEAMRQTVAKMLTGIER